MVLFLPWNIGASVNDQDLDFSYIIVVSLSGPRCCSSLIERDSRLSTVKLYFGDFLSLTKSPTNLAATDFEDHRYNEDSTVASFRWWDFPFRSFNGRFYDIVITEQGTLVWVNWENGHVIRNPPTRTAQLGEFATPPIRCRAFLGVPTTGLDHVEKTFSVSRKDGMTVEITKTSNDFYGNSENGQGHSTSAIDNNSKEVVVVIEGVGWGLCISENGHQLRYWNNKSQCHYNHYSEVSRVYQLHQLTGLIDTWC